MVQDLSNAIEPYGLKIAAELDDKRTTNNNIMFVRLHDDNNTHTKKILQLGGCKDDQGKNVGAIPVEAVDSMEVLG